MAMQQLNRLLETDPPDAHRKAAIRGAKKHKLVLDLLEGRKVSDEELAKVDSKAASAKRGKAFKDAMDDMTVLMGREPELPPLTDKQRETATSRFATSSAHLKFVQAFRKPKEFGSALNLAVKTGDPKIVEALLQAGLPSELVSSALCTAAYRRDRSMVDLLLKAGAKPSGAGDEAIINAAESGDAEIVRLLLEAGADPKARTDGGETAMTAASGPFANKIKDMLKQAAGRKKQKQKAAPSATRNNLARKLTSPPPKAPRISAKPWATGMVARLHRCRAGTGRAGIREVASLDRWHQDTANRQLQAKPPVILIFRLRGHAWRSCCGPWVGFRATTLRNCQKTPAPSQKS